VVALVLGATGFVGREVVRQLSVRATPVIAHVRPDSGRLAEWQQRFGELGAEIDTTAWDVPELARTLRERQPAQLYLLVGTTRARARADQIEGDIYEQVDVGLVRIAVEAARASELRPRLVYLSSVGASETARSAYLRARARAEELVRTSGLPWVIARPSFIVGDRDEARPGERGVALVGDGLLAVAGLFGGGRLRAKYRSTTPDVLASALIRLGEAPEHDHVAEGAELR
jgi:uncharacterized protein YbjT (DUF2867 family)